MLLLGFPSTAFATNCYVIAPAAGEECVIVDPGIEIEDRLAEILTQHRLRPAAVLLTHGHLDHTYSVTPVCGSYGVAARLHADDRYRLADPLGDLEPSLLAMLEQQFGGAATWQEPSDVVEISGGTRLSIAGLNIGVRHAPGHTEGSVLFDLPGVPEGIPAAELSTTMLSGDVLFAGSIGRYDGKGGDGTAMRTTLREVVLPLADDILVLPGHGPATTMAQERATNPYLLDLGLVS